MKERADKVLTNRGLVSSRSQAKSLIEKGDVTANGTVVKKAGELIDTDSDLKISSPLFVGRGAFKLEKALQEFHIQPEDKVCLDIGASTGGFTEVLLLNGARKVYAIDVGHGQLAARLREDPRVVNMEGTNIKEVDRLPELAELAVMDLSFISITKVLGKVFSLLSENGELVALIKPQFEAGKERLPKDGVIKDPEVRKQILDEVLLQARELGWKSKKTVLSPIEGKGGNTEYLCHFIKDQSHSGH